MDFSRRGGPRPAAVGPGIRLSQLRVPTAVRAHQIGAGAVRDTRSEDEGRTFHRPGQARRLDLLRNGDPRRPRQHRPASLERDEHIDSGSPGSCACSAVLRCDLKPRAKARRMLRGRDTDAETSRAK